MRFTIRALLLLTATAAIAVAVWQHCQPMDHFEIVVSGTVASKFEDGSRVVVWRRSEVGLKPLVCDLVDLPLKLTREGYQNRNLSVGFLGPKSSEVLCSVFLFQSLFDTPRRINLKLNCPNSTLHPVGNGWRHQRYSTKISQRMKYHHLPYWCEATKKLEPCKNLPTIKVVNTRTGDTLLDEPMTTSCFDSRWFYQIPRDVNVRDQYKLVFVADYDSGGLFFKSAAVFNFTYHESLHR